MISLTEKEYAKRNGCNRGDNCTGKCKGLGEEYIGAVPSHKNRDGEQVYQVYFDYVRECGARVSGNWELMTSSGTRNVRAI